MFERWNSAGGTLQARPLNRAFHYNTLFLRIADDGSNRKLSVSHDGYYFVEQFAEANNTLDTHNQVGFAVMEQGAVTPVSINVYSWVEA